MRSLRLKNFRSLVDTGRVELRPLTVLVGANSSGKSSFLRFFPLLRQTFNKSAASPLLWYGRDVDFGDYSRAVRRGAEAEGIEIEIEIDVPGLTGRAIATWSAPLPLRLSSVLDEEDGKTYVRRSVVTCHDDVCEREFRDRSGVALLRVNDLDIVQGPPVRRSSYALHGDTSLVPGLFRSDPTSRNGPFKSVESRLRQALRQLFSPSVYGRTDVLGIVSGIQYSGAEDLLEQLREQDHGTRWRRQVARLTTSSPDVLELKTLLLANCMTDLLEVARLTLEREAKAITYIGPSRVPGERFYRMQELAVGYMDPRGENLAMFLKALSPDQLARFSDFVLKHIGFRVRLEAQGSNVSILLEDDLQRSYNLIDMGYGFSQVLPLVAQCWATASGWRPSERDPLPELIAIEQPELHLHPHYQAKLADMFVMTLQAGRDAWTLSRAKNEELDTVPPKLIVETHSDALLNRLGELVEEGRLPAEDVLVLLFEQDPITKDTTLRQSSFSPDGTLTNWPIGFFAP